MTILDVTGRKPRLFLLVTCLCVLVFVDGRRPVHGHGRGSRVTSTIDEKTRGVVETTKVLALGRTAHFGFIYDPRTESFTGQSLFQFNSQSIRQYLDSQHPNLITVKETPSSHAEFKILTKLQDKFDLAGIDPSLAVTFLAGQLSDSDRFQTLNIGGSAKFLLDEPQTSTDNYLAASLLHQMRTKKETLHIDQEELDPFADWTVVEKLNGSVNGLQIVTEIEWGANFAVNVFQHSDSGNRENAQNIRNGLSMRLYQLAFDSAHGQGQGQGHGANDPGHLDLGQNKSSNYTLHIFQDLESDLELGLGLGFQERSTSPLTFEDAKKLLKKMPETLQDVNGGKGVQISYTLYPLSKVVDFFRPVKPSSKNRNKVKVKVTGQGVSERVPEVNLDPTIYKRVIGLFEKVNKFRLTLGDLHREVEEGGGEQCLSGETFRDMGAVKSHLENVTTIFQLKIRSLKEDLTSSKNEGEWTQTLGQFDGALQEVGRLIDSDLFHHARRKLEVYRMFREHGRISYLGRHSSKITEFVKKSEEASKITYILYYKPEWERSEVKSGKSGWAKNLQLFLNTLDKPWNLLAVADCDFNFQDCMKLNQTAIHQYRGGNLTHSDCLKRMSVKVKSSQRFEQPALGRRLVVGDLYDARTEKFTGGSIFKKLEDLGLENSRFVTSNGTLLFEEYLNSGTASFVPIIRYPNDPMRKTVLVAPAHPWDAQFRALKIKDRDLQLAILSGLLPLNNSGLFFPQPQSNNFSNLNSSEMKQLYKSVMVTINTGKMYLNVSSLSTDGDDLNFFGLTDPDPLRGFTHYVKEVEYGHTSFVSMVTSSSSHIPRLRNQNRAGHESGPDNEPRPEELQIGENDEAYWETVLQHDLENLSGALRQFPNVSEYVDQLSFSRSYFGLFSDTLPEKFQRLETIRQVFDQLTQAHQMVSDRPIDQPTAFILEPIETLAKQLGVVTPGREYRRFSPKDDEVIRWSGEVFEGIVEARAELDSLKGMIDQHSFCLHKGQRTEAQERITRVQRKFREDVRAFQHDFTRRLVQIKSTQYKPVELEKLIQGFLKDNKFHFDFKFAALDSFQSYKERIESCLADGDG